MNNLKLIIERNKNHLFAILAIVVISAAYLPGVFGNKTLSQGDITQYKGAASEYTEFTEKGEKILWTNSQFSGMPTYQISGVNHENPLRFLRFPKKPMPWDKLFLMMICAYIMFVSFRVKPWLALIGSVAMSFVTGNMTIIEAGHNTQALAIAYAPLIIAGVQFMFRQRWLLGFNLTALGMGLQLISNHVQITYYTGIIIGIWMIFQLIKYIKGKDEEGYSLANYFKVAGIAIAAVVVGIGANAMNLMLTQEYLPHTIRGKSELTIGKDQQPLKKVSEGLSYDYAFQWSNGWDDIGGMFIPHYAGGGSPTGNYYGALPFTSGPQYMGITVIFLCLLGFLLLQDLNRWWILSALLISIILSLGKNHFVFINEFFFDYVPFYNKFRAPTMALTIAQICIPILAVLGLSKFITRERKDQEQQLKYAGIGIGAFLIILTFFSGIFNDYLTPPMYNEQGVAVDNDSRIIAQNKLNPAQVDQYLVTPRKEEVRKDGLRSIVFVGLLFLVLFYYNKGKLKLNYALGVIGLLILIDLWGVDKRYLSSDNLRSQSQMASEMQPTQADLEIMKDDGYYRVLDMSASPTQSARASNFHYSIGGYNAAKIRRYQELFDWYIYSEMNGQGILTSPYMNMLNCKYIMFKNKQDGPLLYQQNQGALGHSWFVSKINRVEDANGAIVAMKDVKPATEAILEAKDNEVASQDEYTVEEDATIVLDTYHPEEMHYLSKNSNKGFAVFSEIYYDDGWNAYIDNEPVDYAQVNYILRGLEIPAGTHEIVFRFEPETYTQSKTITYVSSGLIFIVLIGSAAWGLIQMNRKEEEQA
ncbi:YfhO family protein [bacterium]|nr:YfhO family protein [bacterium]